MHSNLKVGSFYKFHDSTLGSITKVQIDLSKDDRNLISHYIEKTSTPIFAKFLAHHETDKMYLYQVQQKNQTFWIINNKKYGNFEFKLIELMVVR